MSQVLTIVRGSDVTIPFTISGVNLTGMTVLFTIKTQGTVDATDVADTNAVCKYSTSTHTDPVNGVTSVVLTGAAASPNNTTQLVPDTYDYDVWTKDAAGNLVPRTDGPQLIKIISSVTQRRS